MILIIRGPAASGKTTISLKLAKKLNCDYVSFDKIMEDYNLDDIEGDGISSENFIKANNLIIPKINETLEKGKKVILDGCFYRKEQINHLEKRFPKKIKIFTLKTSLEKCIQRNKDRNSDMPKEAIKDVFNLVEKLNMGIPIETSNKSAQETLLIIEKLI